MEENISHAIAMTMSVFLFVFALSAAIMRYSSMNYTAENLISINVVNRRGTAADDQLKEADIKRLVEYPEIALAILNMADNINVTGNSKYTVEVIKLNGNKKCKCKYDEEDDGLGGKLGKIVLEFDDGSELSFYTGDLAGISFRNTTDEFLSEAVKFFAGPSGDTKYNVSYTEDSIVYTEAIT